MHFAKYSIMKNGILTGIFLGLSLLGFAQQNLNSDNRQQAFNDALELFEQKKYSAAQHAFSKFMERDNINDALLKEDAEYYASICAMKLYNRDVNHLIEEFIFNHPENPKINQASFQLANHYYRETKYRSALKWYDKVDKLSLPELQLSEYFFKTGFSHYARKDYSKADKAFYEIYNNNDFYGPLAKYFYSHIKYLNKQYQTALEGFQDLSNHELFAKIVPFYITQVYHIQKRYDDVIEYAPEMLETIQGERTNEIARIIAEAYFKTGKYEKALEWMKKYESNAEELSDTDYYQLGFAYFQKGQYNQSASYLKEVIGVEDSLTQNAAYHLAKCYVEMGEKNRAKTAFGIAAYNEFDKEIAEDALFNYAKICFELDYSPFAEAINSFNRFITKYPNSIRIDEAYDFLLQAVLSTKNYEQALDVIQQIPQKTPEINEAYQRLAYFRALEYFADINLEKAIEYFDKSLEYKQYNSKIKALALYWKGDALYRSKKYELAIKQYNDFLITSGAIGLNEYGKAYYNVGYAFFKQNKYEKAGIWFRKYEEHSNEINSELMCDAYGRIGDCYFVNSQFAPAKDYYTKATENCSYNVDYAWYQRAIAQGRLKNHQEKINNLHILRGKFPESRYHAGALYEIARTFHSNIENQDSAIYHYQAFTNQYPNNPQMRSALASLANLYFANQQFELSLTTCKSIVEKFPGTNESMNALEMIKNISVEMNNPDYYVDYIESEGIETDVTEFEKDSLVYESAQKLFVSNDIDGAITAFQRYLDKYPNGNFSLEANFYQAQCFYSKEQFEHALLGYQHVIEKPTNMFTEESLLKAATISFDEEKYEQAYTYYAELEKLTEQKSRVKIARLGMLRASWLSENYDYVVLAAQKMLEIDDLSDAETRESHYKLANAYYKTDKPNKALSHYSALSNEVTSYEGGEAKYFVAKINHEMGNDELAENTIVDFSQQNSPHRFWLAKGFLLLADIYVERMEYFQASHILQSLLDNYTDEVDGIKEEAREKQMQIRQLEEQDAMQDKNMRIPKPETEVPADSTNSPNVEQEIPENNE
jgi:tetratricopeptide (TPR) repeat protein